jgi:hypothetical protein
MSENDKKQHTVEMDAAKKGDDGAKGAKKDQKKDPKGKKEEELVNILFVKS